MSNESLSSLITQGTIEKMKSSLEMLGSIESMKIADQSQYEAAAKMQIEIKKASKELDSDRTAIVKPWNDKVKAVNDKFKEVTTKLENGSKKIGLALSTYFQEQERLRIAEQNRLNAIAEEKRIKAEEAAEKERLKADQYREQGREDMAEKADARADAKIEVASSIVSCEVEAVKVEGISFRTDYIVEITDHVAAATQLLSNSITESIVEINLGTLKKMVSAAKGKFNCEGIKITETKTPVTRTK